MDTLLSLPFTGILVTIVCYAAGLWIKKITAVPFANPMMIASVLGIILIVCTPLTTEQYFAGGNLITMFIGSGVPGLTAAAVIITGVTTAAFAPVFIRLFKLKDPLAAGIAIGVSGHAIGTAAAIELGETEGAMSGLAMCLMGIVTSIIYLFLI